MENKAPLNGRIARSLSMVAEIRADWTTYDLHLHPTEVAFNFCDYTEHDEISGLFSSGRTAYAPPSMDQIGEQWERGGKDEVQFQRLGIAKMFLQKAYAHTGPRVFEDSFEISGIDKGMLLTVAPRTRGFDRQMEVTRQMFGNRERFRIAGSVPNDIQNGHIEGFLRRAAMEKGIAAVKIHPNISGLNPAAAEGKERLEYIGDACGLLGLPLIIHTGRSNFVDAPFRGFGDLRNLRDLNWSSKTAVVLAHGGAYGYPLREVEEDIIPILKGILNKHPNTFVDVSALSCEKMKVLLSHVGTERIMFGSDALYENQCIMLAGMVCALEETGKKAELDLVTVLSQNPGTYIFKENPNKDQKTAPGHSTHPG